MLILSMYDDERYVLSAVKVGARGYVLKNSAGEELIQAIYAVQRGMAFFSPAVARIFRDGVARVAGMPGRLRPLRILSPTASARCINFWPKATATRISPTVST